MQHLIYDGILMVARTLSWDILLYHLCIIGPSPAAEDGQECHALPLCAENHLRDEHPSQIVCIYLSIQNYKIAQIRAYR